ncbi:hypothetical protein FQN54_000868 [Arachnomyces sp. PD_36]|nr:hypothetical protein FQN54_000868 [Arachnomyces sp. PD_36]
MRQDERALERIYAWRRVREEVDPGRRIYKRIRQPKIIRKLDIIPEDEEVRLFECVFEPTTPQQLIQRPPLGSYGAYQQDHQAAAVHNSGGSLYTAAAPTARVDLYPARTPEHCSYIPEIPHLPTPGPQERPTFIERHLAFGYILPSRSRFTRRGKEKKGEKSMRSERVSSFFGRGVLGFSSGMKGDKGKRKGKEKADDDRCEGDRGSDGSDRTPRGSDDGSSSASNRT